MTKNTIISVPVRKHVKQFILREFGGDVYTDQPLPIHQNTLLGKCVVLAVEKQPYRQLRVKETPPSRAELNLALPKALKHYTISKQCRKELGEALDKLFVQQFLFFVKGQVLATQNEYAAITMFYKIYEIDADSFDIETARKSWRDYKDKLLKINLEDGIQYSEMLSKQPVAA